MRGTANRRGDDFGLVQAGEAFPVLEQRSSGRVQTNFQSLTCTAFSDKPPVFLREAQLSRRNASVASA